MKPRSPIPKLSAKRRESLKGRPCYSTIQSRPKPLKKRARSKSERERIYGPKGYVEWIHEQPCIACAVRGYSEVAHIRTGGTGRKDDWTRTVPLCGPQPTFMNRAGVTTGCHKILHLFGRNTFEADWGIDLEAEAAKCQERWLSSMEQEKE